MQGLSNSVWGLANSCRLVKFLSERRAFSVKHCGDFLLFDVYRNLNDPDLTKRIFIGRDVLSLSFLYPLLLQKMS